MDIAAVVPVTPAPPPAPVLPGELAEGFGAVLGEVLEAEGRGREFDAGGDPGEFPPEAMAPGGAFPCTFAPELVRALLPWGGGAEGAAPERAPAGEVASQSSPEGPVPAAGAQAPWQPGEGGDAAFPLERGGTPPEPEVRAEAVVPRTTPIQAGSVRSRGEARGHDPAAPPPGERPWAAPGDRARAERLWGFWLRQGSGAGRAPGPAGEMSVTRGADSNGVGRGGAGELAGDAPGSVPFATPDALPEKRPIAEGTAEGAPDRPSPEVTAVTARQGGETPREVPGREQAPPAPPARQVAHAVHVVVGRGGDRVAVRLEPEHLGRVEVVLGREAGGVTAHLRVESAQAHQALTAEIPLLREALEARGVSLIHVQIDLDDRSQGGQRPGSEAGGRRRRGAPGRGQAEPALAAAGAERWRPWGFETLI